MKQSYLSTDVAYHNGIGYGIGLVFNKFTDDVADGVIEVIVPDVGDYIPGEFYKRELKVLVAIYKEYIKIYKKPPLLIFIDAYVNLGDKIGCGQYFAEDIDNASVIVGIAKNAYTPADSICEKVLRGDSIKPLFVTSTIISKEAAAVVVKKLHGKHRFPTLIKKTDMLTKEFVQRNM
jgi:deoxyribonuclease V